MKSTTRILLLSLGLLLIFSNCRQTTEMPKGIKSIAAIPQSTVDDASMSAEALDALSAHFQAHLDSGHVPMIQAMAIHKGKVAYQFTGGYQDYDSKTPLQEDAIFRLASMTKPITGAAIMILYDEGKIKLDDPVSKFIPEFANPTLVDTFNEEDTTYTTKPASREITITDLMTHTSGVIYPTFDPESPVSKINFKAGIENGFSLNDVTLAENTKKLAKLPLAVNPGEKYIYSMSIDVLGYVVEVVSGMTLAEFFEKRIFEPLGMDDTYFYLPEDKHDRLAAVYPIGEEGKLINAADVPALPGSDVDNAALVDYPIAGAQKIYSGGGGLVGTTEDYARFGLMMLNGGELYGTRILSEEAVDLMTTNHLDPAVFGQWKYGLSIVVSDPYPGALNPDKKGGFGWGGLFKTRWTSNPSDDLVLVYMTQSFPNPYVDKIYDQATRMLYGAIKRPAPVSAAE